MTAIRHTEAFWLDSQLDCPFRDRLWNLAPFQATAVQKLPRTRAGWGTRPWVCTRSTLQSQKEQENHGKASKAARLRKGPHFLWPHKSQTTPLQELRRNQSKEWVITKKQKRSKTKKQSQSCLSTQSTLISNPSSLCGAWMWNVKVRRPSESWPFLLRNFSAVRLATAVGETCAALDPHSAAWAHSRGMQGEGPLGAWEM